MAISSRIYERPWRLWGLILLAGILGSGLVAWAQYPSSPQVHKDGTAVLLQDYASLPLSSPLKGDVFPPPMDFHEQLGRANSLRSEPANAPLAATRFFVNDLNGTLYILDKKTRKFIPYIKFPDIFPRFTTDPGYAGGIVSIAFDPNYSKNGKFYTVHTEDPEKQAPAEPTNAKTPDLKLSGYTTTATVDPPAGGTHWESVLVEWTDTNIRNSTFEGTARELLRVGFTQRIHQMDDLLFDPLAKPGQPDYGNLYISVGDGQAGETPGPTHPTPQRLDALQGKILRITPDISLRPKDRLSPDGRYRIPSTGRDPNPFVSVAGARGEIFAYGFRNPQRMSWDPVSNTLIVDDIGLHSWEEVDIVKKGANYGYAEREGNEQLFVPQEGKTGSQLNPPVPFPAKDLLTVKGLDEPVVPLYPAAVYSHREGDSIGSGFVYRGKLLPQLRGKYIFNDITTGRIFYTDLAAMLATQGIRNHQAKIHEIQIMYKSPYDQSAKAPAKWRMYDIVAAAYAHKGGLPGEGSVLPGASADTGGWRGKIHRKGISDPEGVPYGGGRADVRMAMGGDGELYVISKSDGMIRKIVSVVTPPPASKQVAGR
jgi:Glucose / Sorbosone dehydrogenase